MTKDELKQEAEEYANARIPKEEMPIRNSELVKAYLAGAEPREKRIAKLEKENEELKSGCGMCYRKDKDQLTKATDFLKGVIEVFVTAPTQFSERQKKDLFEDIEQFLSEVEK